MKKLLVLLLCLGLTGCASLSGIRIMNRQNLLKLSIGMTKQEALNVMGTRTFKTYADGTINNPYRSEILSNKEGRVFEVVHYYTDVKSLDGVITDDELTPLIFDNGKLIGWGQSFLQDNILKYKLKLRSNE
jgi:hypothetical protein